MKILIAVPCLDQLDVEFVKSLIYMKPVGNCRVDFVAGSLVYASRERFCEIALKEKTDYVLWLDSDMIFTDTLLLDLLNDEKDIVSALCFRRRPPYNPVIYKKIKMGLPGEAQTEQYDDYPKDDIFEVDACGFGGVLVKTEVIEAVVNKYNCAFVPIPGYGEDISFCIRAKELGYKIFCDSRVKMGHMARVVCDEKSYEALR